MANVLCRGSGKCLADSNSNSNLKTLFYKDCSLGSGAVRCVLCRGSEMRQMFYVGEVRCKMFYVGAVRCGKMFYVGAARCGKVVCGGSEMW